MAADKKLKLRISRGLGGKKKPAGLVPSWVQIPPPAKIKKEKGETYFSMKASYTTNSVPTRAKSHPRISKSCANPFHTEVPK